MEGSTIHLGTPHDGRDVDTLMKNSDSAMYHATELNAAASERLMFESELRSAINQEQQEQLVLHYQPVVEISSGGIVSLEALVRWNRPGHGLTPPDQFIPTAETSGMIIPLGQWVVRQVCRQIKLWDKGKQAMVQAIMGIARHLQVENVDRQIRSMTLIPSRGPAPRRPSQPGPLLYNVTVNRFRSISAS